MWMATRASLLGVFAAHALLLAFTLKLRAAAVLRQQEGRLAQGEREGGAVLRQQEGRLAQGERKGGGAQAAGGEVGPG